ncbi:MAG: exodeoxyribonuclease III [Archangium sp.]
MKIVTWNVNSIRARLDRLLEFLKTRSPDVLCLQELKCTDDQFPHTELDALGFQAAVFGQKTYNGVAIITRKGEAVTDVARNMGDDDDEARVIAATIRGIRVVGLYAPNGQALGAPQFTYKLEWYARLSRWLSRVQRPLLVTGDFNVAPAEIDTWNVALWTGVTLASPKEREALSALMQQNSLVDLVRAKRGQEAGFYTWWDYRAGAFKKNQGLRIDHMLVSPELVERCTAIDVDREAREGKQPSDHAPLAADVT